MTKRPDSQDRAHGRHEACLCGDSLLCTCRPLSAPSQGFRFRPWWPICWGDLPLVRATLRVDIDAKLNTMLKEIKKMAVSVDKVLADIQTLVAGGQAKDALIKQLQDALASADADKAQAVADAVSADDAGIQAQIDAADAVAQEYLNPSTGDVPPAA